MGPNSRGQDHEDKFTSPRTGRGQIFEAEHKYLRPGLRLT